MVPEGLAARHAIGDVVAEEDVEIAARLGVQEGVKVDGSPDARTRHPHGRRQGVDGRLGHKGISLLYRNQVLKKEFGFMPPGRQQAANHLGHGLMGGN